MNRRNFFRMFGAATAAAVAAPVLALLPAPAPLLRGHLGSLDGFKVYERSPKRTWRGGEAQLQNLPREFVEFTDGSAAAPAYTFSSDTNTGWYRNESNTLQLSIAGKRYLK